MNVSFSFAESCHNTSFVFVKKQQTTNKALFFFPIKLLYLVEEKKNKGNDGELFFSSINIK